MFKIKPFLFKTQRPPKKKSKLPKIRTFRFFNSLPVELQVNIIEKSIVSDIFNHKNIKRTSKLFRDVCHSQSVNLLLNGTLWQKTRNTSYGLNSRSFKRQTLNYLAKDKKLILHGIESTVIYLKYRNRYEILNTSIRNYKEGEQHGISMNYSNVLKTVGKYNNGTCEHIERYVKIDKYWVLMQGLNF
jgi:hypothetical protein